ncbi:hypothetical protein ACQPZA_34260 [Pseudonocardia xinjiangensis]|uniref:hypothetical protein n=1 Tax=Pseudonocardia xinjiangensis TaxID=75289 RepID=UPI003D8B2259
MTEQLGSIRRRAVVTLVPPVVAGAVTAGTYAVLAHRLPDQAYGTGGFGDSMSWTRMVGLGIGWSVVALIWGAGWLYARRRIPTAQRWIGASTWVGSVLIAGYEIQLVLRHLDLAGPPVRPDLWWTSAPVVLPVLAVVALAAWWAMGPDPEQPDAMEGPGSTAPRLRLAAGERALWTRSVFSRRKLAWALFWAVLAAWFAATGNGYLAVTFSAFTAVASAAQSWARVRIDEQGVQVVQPLLRQTLAGVELRHVVEATAGAFDPSTLPRATYGVFHTPAQSGYRATAGGDALRLRTSNGHRFVITVPGAATAAALVNTQLDRRRATAGDDRC